MKKPRLREPVTLFEPSDTSANSWGAPDGDSYAKVATRKAEVEEDAGSVDRRAGRDEPQQRVTLKMRYWDRVSTEDYFKWRGKILRVTGVKALGQERRWMEVSTYIDRVS